MITERQYWIVEADEKAQQALVFMVTGSTALQP
jgi:hypothetical protein